MTDVLAKYDALFVILLTFACDYQAAIYVKLIVLLTGFSIYRIWIWTSLDLGKY